MSHVTEQGKARVKKLRGKLMKKEKKRDCSCVEGHPECFENPVDKVKRIKNNFVCAYQRIKYGYCYQDVWSIDRWFLSVMPNMLDDLRKTTQGYPSTMFTLCDDVQAVNRDEDEENGAIEKWNQILAEMAFLLREAHEETCSKDNPYEDEWWQAHLDFEKKYGYWGERLKTKEELEMEKIKHVHISHTMGDVPEYKDIVDKYLEAERQIEGYRNECKNKGIKMFGEWFWNLWD